MSSTRDVVPETPIQLPSHLLILSRQSPLNQHSQNRKGSSAEYDQPYNFTFLLLSPQTLQFRALIPLSQCLEASTYQHNLPIYSRTPLNICALNSELISHPDHTFVHNLIVNLINGCDIGYIGPLLAYCSNNLYSAFQQRTIPDATIAEKCGFWGHLITLYSPASVPLV